MKYSVIIPAYNKSDLISDAIESILSQKTKDYEIIVIDDGSSDDLDTVIKKYPLVKLIRQQNSGVSVARNTGIEAAQGEFICFLDADDKWLSNHFEVLDDLIERYPDENYFVTSHITTTSDGKEFKSSRYIPQFDEDFICKNLFKLLNDNSDGIINTNSFCIRRSILIENNIRFEPGEKIGEDTDMWFRTFLYSPLVISKTETTIYRRENSTATLNTTNTLKWIFSRRLDDILNMDLDLEIKTECIKLIDRYKMTCSREYLLNHNRAEAFGVLKEIKYKTFKYFISIIFCFMPYSLFRCVYKLFF